MSDKKRYEAVYVHPNFCDGFWDNEEVKYLEIDEIKDKLYENMDNDEIERILNKKGNEEQDNEEMSGFKLALEGFGLALFGIISLLWVIIKIVSCIFVAGLISTKMGLNGNYWWFASIIIFSLICKILFLGNQNKTYSNLIDNYNEKVNE